MTNKLTAGQLLEALAVKHSKDVFIPECKTGQSWGGFRAMDAWVMPRSWAHPWVTAYEIKVDRGDFMRDDKWPHYLDYCNRFYFVCPWGLIQPEEVGENAGLMWATANASRLITKRKAPIRKEQQIPEDVFRYVLMSRSRFTGEDEFDRHSIEDARAWLEHRNESTRLGQAIATTIARVVSRRTEEARRDLEKAKTESERAVKALDELRPLYEALKELGIHAGGYYYSRPRDLMDELRKAFGLPAYKLESIRHLRDSMNEVLDANGAEATEAD